MKYPAYLRHRIAPALVGIFIGLSCFIQVVRAEPEAQQTILQSRQSLAEDPFRPLFHFSSPKGKLWEPGGFCKWKGRYHLYYFGKYGLFCSPRIIKPGNDGATVVTHFALPDPRNRNISISGKGSATVSMVINKLKSSWPEK